LYDEVTSVSEQGLPETTSTASAWDIALGPANPDDILRSERPDDSPPIDDAGDSARAEASADDAGFGQPSDTEDGPRDVEAPTDPTTSPRAGILESMAFSDDEDVDDSVSRYMQHLLARSPQSSESGGGNRDRYVAVPTGKRSDTVVGKPDGTTVATSSDVSLKPESVRGNPAEASPRDLERPFPFDLSHSTQPVHVQNKDAVRAATEQMRQVANQQTVTNVEAANWKQLKRSIRTKLVLAALAFLLSAGLLYCGYHYRPEFMILGICTSGLGVLTWLDLILAIRQAQTRAAKLTGRKKPTGPVSS
jgi:hypothetical protein